jgi:MFS family permease
MCVYICLKKSNPVIHVLAFQIAPRINISTKGLTVFFCALQVIGACAASRFGGKAVLLFAVFLWSVSTSVTPFLATSVPALIFCRVLLGLGEGLGKLIDLCM